MADPHPILQNSSILPIHFFTIVLNGEPFIRYHINIFKQLPFPWHWHIVEGVADLKHDTAWSLNLGGQISNSFHNNGRSNDGTSEYLDELKQHFSEHITIYRKPEGIFWDGKREMVNAPLVNIQNECLLWQIDVDELWTVEQIGSAYQLFLKHPEKTAAFYWCWYFVGQDRVVSSRHCYSQNPQQEWLRTWRFQPGYVWAAHEPPQLVRSLPDGTVENIAAIAPLTHEETEKEGLIFQHFAYVMPKQLHFKEQYYGYKNAVSQWRALQEQTKFPLRLRQYFDWVGDFTTVEKAKTLGIQPIAQPKADNLEEWQFVTSATSDADTPAFEPPSPLVVIDGVFFQRYKTGIARVWKSLLEEWVESGFSQNVVVLDRYGTAPDIAGIRYQIIPPYNANHREDDRQLLQQVCDELGGDLFISTYFTRPLSTPSVVLIHDMIPEVMGEGWDHPIVREKREAIEYASNYIAVSQNTANDVVRFLGDRLHAPVTVAHNGVASTFKPASQEQIDQFRYKYGINKPYFMAMSVDNPSPYKNNQLFFKAFSLLQNKAEFDLVCTAIETTFPDEWRNLTAGCTVHLLRLTDEELAIAYSGAIAFIYPSQYEGFGMPVLEAMACGCPVITCPNSSLPEVAGEAAIYVNETDVDSMVKALKEAQKFPVRDRLIATGLEQAKSFSWKKMGAIVQNVLVETSLFFLNLRAKNLIIFPDWNQPEEDLYFELQNVISALLSHPDQTQITLLIDVSQVSENIDPNFAIAEIVMSFMMEADLDTEPSISLVDRLSSLQWDVLAAKLTGIIRLKAESSGVMLAQQRNVPDIQFGDRLENQ